MLSLSCEAAAEAPATSWRSPAAWIRQQKLDRGFWTFFAVAFFFDAGFSVYFFLFNLYLLDCHFDERAIGLVGGSLTLGTVAGTLPAGALANKIGLRPLVIVCLASAPLAASLRVLWIWEPAQIGFAFLAGLAMSLWGVCFLSAVAGLTTLQDRTSAFSLIFSVSIGTAMLGGLICGYLPQWLRLIGVFMYAGEAKRFILLVSCGIVLIGLIPAYRLRFPEKTNQPAPAMTKASGWRQCIARSPFLLRYLPMMALWSAILAAFTAFGNVYLSREIGLSMKGIGLIFSAVQGLQLCMGLMTPVIFRVVGLINGIVAMQLVAAILFGVMAAARSSSVAIPLYLALSAAQWMCSPGLYTLLMNETAERERSAAAAMTLFCNALAGSAAIAVAGSLFTRLGYPPVLRGIAALAFTVAIAFLLLLGRHGSTDRAATAPLTLGRQNRTVWQRAILILPCKKHESIAKTKSYGEN